MIRHIVLFRVNEGTSKALQYEACERLEALVPNSPGLTSLQAGLDIGIEGNFDFGLVAEFEDRAALDRFSSDAAHLDVAYWIAEFRKDIVVFDMEI